jgi:heme exporter protein A
VGPNGIGKTTLLAPVRPGAGIGREPGRGRAVGRVGAEYFAELGYLGHANALKTDLTARENLRYLVGVRRPLAGTEIDGALERVGIVDCADLPVRVMSAGQRRRLSLARLWLWPAALWILDEPATNLDSAGLALVESMIRDHLHRGGLAVVAAHQRLLDEVRVRRLSRGDRVRGLIAAMRSSYAGTYWPGGATSCPAAHFYLVVTTLFPLSPPPSSRCCASLAVVSSG